MGGIHLDSQALAQLAVVECPNSTASANLQQRSCSPTGLLCVRFLGALCLLVLKVLDDFVLCLNESQAAYL